MTVQNQLTISDREFLARSIGNWQEALRRGDMPTFEYWAVHAFCFARTLNLSAGYIGAGRWQPYIAL